MSKNCVYFSLWGHNNGTLYDGVTTRTTADLRMDTSSVTIAENMLHSIASELTPFPTAKKFVRKDQGYLLDLSNIDVVQETAKKFFSVVHPVPQRLVERVLKFSVETKSDEYKGQQVHLLYPYQKIGVEFAMKNKKVYIADGMGAGKTATAILAAEELRTNRKVLIVVPAILRFTWRSEITKWLPHTPETAIKVIRSEPDLQKIKDTHAYIIVSYNVLAKEVAKRVFANIECFIFDEAHYLKNMRSKRTKNAIHLTKKSHAVLMLSGTPFNKSVELYSAFRILAPEVFPKYWNFQMGSEWGDMFVNRYCDPQPSFNSSFSLNGCKKKEEMFALLATFMIRREKKDILHWLPLKSRLKIELPVPEDAQAKKTLQKIDEILNRDVHASQKDQEYAFMEAWRLTSAVKIKEVTKYVSYVVPELVENKTKFIVFVHHTLMREAVEAQLRTCGVPYFSIYGAVPETKRQEYQVEFQTGNKYQAAVLSLTAACTGLTLHAASVVIFTEISFGPDIMTQAEDRVHRIGQTVPVQIQYLCLPGTTDPITMGLICKKHRQATHIMNGRADHLGIVNPEKKQKVE
jgi:SWI/SNF-related matrix-associated actin-dependent regulator 1 of chromatin subfamily A